VTSIPDLNSSQNCFGNNRFPTFYLPTSNFSGFQSGNSTDIDPDPDPTDFKFRVKQKILKQQMTTVGLLLIPFLKKLNRRERHT